MMQWWQSDKDAARVSVGPKAAAAAAHSTTECDENNEHAV
jgi:hypothetical protein